MIMQISLQARAASKFRTDGLAFTLGLVTLVLLLSFCWTAWILPPFNSEHLGGDAMEHAVMIEGQSRTNPAERELLLANWAQDYPPLSHWLASRVMPLLEGDAYKAMRFMSCVVVLLLFLFQFQLLRVSLGARAALLVLLLWQMVCYLNNLGNTQYFCVAYFYAQAVGTVFVWPALIVFSRPVLSRSGQFWHGAGGILFAACAYLCHIVPGAIVFGALGLFTLVRLLNRPNRDDGIRLALLAVIGLLVLVGSGGLKYMGGVRNYQATAPLKNYLILVSWVPTVLLALIWSCRHWRGVGQGDWPARIRDVVLCLLVTAGCLQAYCAFEWAVLGWSASYPVLKLFYILFPFSSLLGFLWASHWLQRTPVLSRWQTYLSAKAGSVPAHRVAIMTYGVSVGLLVFLQMKVFVKNELLGSSPPSERQPALVAHQFEQRLRAAQAMGIEKERSDLLYFDPEFPLASTFVNIVGLHRKFDDAYRPCYSLRGWDPRKTPLPPSFKKEVNFSRLLLPGEDQHAGSVSIPGRP